MKSGGDAVVVHRLRGRSSNPRIDQQTQARVMELLKQPEWHDFNLVRGFAFGGAIELQDGVDTDFPDSLGEGSERL
jgi:hypothetical protein